MYRYKRKVQYHETDKMGVTHHSNYIKWMEEARIAFLESIDLPFQTVEAKGIVSPVVSVSVDYKKPCTFGDEIVVEVAVNKYDGVRLEVGYTMKNSAADTLVATASSHCFIKNQRICSLKKADAGMHEVLKKALESDNAET